MKDPRYLSTAKWHYFAFGADSPTSQQRFDFVDDDDLSPGATNFKVLFFSIKIIRLFLDFQVLPSKGRDGNKVFCLEPERLQTKTSGLFFMGMLYYS